MKLKFRLALVGVVLVVGVIVTVALTSGGGDDTATTKTASTSTGPAPAIEGPQLRMGDLIYNVAGVRVLDYDSPSAAPYLVNTERPTKGNGFLGVFLRVYNVGTKPQVSAAGYLLQPSKQPGLAEQDLGINNPFAFAVGATVPPGGVVPKPGTPAAAGKFPGGFLLYPVNDETVKDQPFDLVIHDPLTGQLANLRLPIVKL